MNRLMLFLALMGLTVSLTLLPHPNNAAAAMKSAKSGTGYLCQSNSACSGTSVECASGGVPADNQWNKVTFYNLNTCFRADWWPLPCSTQHANVLCWESWTWYGTGCVGTGTYDFLRVTSCD